MLPRVLDIATLAEGYRTGAVSPADVVRAVVARIEAWPDQAVWISRRPLEALLAEAEALVQAGPARPDQPLWGIPFGVKDNIDATPLATTAACPDFAYVPAQDAVAVARLRAAGAILIGKTNLDQFATGLNGTRSPYGAPRCGFVADYVSGGSSSGSAGAVASGQGYGGFGPHSGRLQQSGRRQADARARVRHRARAGLPEPRLHHGAGLHGG